MAKPSKSSLFAATEGPALARRWLALRAAANVLAALALAWGALSGWGLLAVSLGAASGTLLGERLARTRIRAVALVGGLLGALLLVTGLVRYLLWSAWFPSLLGPGAALSLGSFVRYSILGITSTAAMRALAARRPIFLGLELGALAYALSALFAGHRDGVVARPLWLGDWAWRQGLDPTVVLLWFGGAAALVLVLSLLLETRRRTQSRATLATWLLLPLLAVIAVFLSRWIGPPTPKTKDNLGLLKGEEGDSGQDPTESGAPAGPGGEPEKPFNPADELANNDAPPRPSQPTLPGEEKQPASPDTNGTPATPKPGDGQAPASPSDPKEGNGSPSGQPQDNKDGQGKGGGQPPPPKEQPNLDKQDGGGGGRPAPVAVVVLGDDYAPPSQIFYLRQEVWSEFNGTRLVPSTRADVDRDILTEFPTQETKVKDAPSSRGRARIHGTVSLLVAHNKPFALESPALFAPIANPNPSRFVGAYRFESLAQELPYEDLLGREPGDRDWTQEQRAYYTKRPGDLRYAALAREIVASLPEKYRDDPFAKALAVKSYLDKELIYSTKHRHAGVDDPTADFLFGDRTGYCTHFAHATVFLWRSLGIPARVGVGYAIQEDQRQGSTLLVQNNSAHAWPELYLDGLGWVVLDISPERNIDPPGEPIDRDLQRMLGEMARNEPPPGAQQRPSLQLKALWHSLLQLLEILAYASVLLLYSAKLWRRLAPRLSGPGELPRVGYRAGLDLLSEAGLWREEGETREDFARRVAAQAPSLAQMTALHLAARLGAPGQPLRGGDIAVWQHLLRALRGELRAGTKRWRRWLGLVNPISFWWSR